MSTIEINGNNLSINLLDADEVERYERLNAEIAEKIKEPTQYEGLSTPDAMRLQCRLINEYFDDMFGPGTADAVFGAGNDLGARMEAFGKVAALAADANAQIKAIQEKYSPNRLTNREQRRATEHSSQRQPIPYKKPHKKHR